MAQNLRVGFKERQRKRVSQALPITPPSAKKSRPEAHCEEPLLAVPMMQVSPSNVVKPRQELVVRPSSMDTCPTGDEAHTATLGGNATKKDTTNIPSRQEKIVVLLKVISCFIAPKPPASDLEEFFPFSHRHFVNLGGNPRMAGMVQQSHVTPDSALYPLLKYIVEETTEVVGFIPLFPKFA